MTLCSVCELRPAEAGALNCQHTFCHDCFERYLSGSLLELDHELRCVICGNRNVLTSESHPDPVLLSFGRDQHPKLIDPCGIAVRKDGEFLFTDLSNGRIIRYTKGGRPVEHYAYMHGSRCQIGAVVTNDDLLAVPMEDHKYVSLAYFGKNGNFKSFCYLPENANIKGLTVTTKNFIVACDAANSLLHVINPSRRYSRSIEVPKLRDERHQPLPSGVGINSFGHIIVCDEANSCLKFFDEDGNYLSRTGSEGEQPGQYRNPSSLCVDSKDRILVADKSNNRVQLVDDRGRFISFVARYNQGDNVYLAPEDLVCTQEDNVAVLLKGAQDAKAAEVRVYKIN